MIILSQTQRSLGSSIRSLLGIAVVLLFCIPSPLPGVELAEIVQSVQPKLVKVYGAGGVRGLESYQSGILIAANGTILTTWSYVLDADPILVVLHDGQRFDAQLVGADPQLEIAILKIDAQQLEYFDLSRPAELQLGDWVLAFSNLYGVATGNESCSVQHGILSSITNLSARRGAFDSTYQGRVYVFDAMTNNAGATGGALTDRQGQLAGLLGKERRDRDSGIWLNYALPIAELTASVDRLKQGESPPSSPSSATDTPPSSWTLELAGLRLVPDLLPITPCYIESVVENSPAGKAGLQIDDLVTFVSGKLIRSQRELFLELRRAPEHEPLRIVVVRGRELIPVDLSPLP